MFLIAVFGILAAFAVMITMARVSLRKFMGYPILCDISVTLILTVLLFGSFSGMVAAIIGGLAFSGMVTVYRRVFGYERLKWTGRRFQWVRYEGRWSFKALRRKIAEKVAGD